jgi:hypothetical protein
VNIQNVTGYLKALLFIKRCLPAPGVFNAFKPAGLILAIFYAFENVAGWRCLGSHQTSGGL